MPATIVVLDQKVNINLEEQKINVKQGDTKISFFKKTDPSKILLYTEGLNPCMGIILKGNIIIDKKDSGYFVILHHYQDDLLNKSTNSVHLKKQIQKNVEVNLFNMLNFISLDSSLRAYDDEQVQIVISESFLVRCFQNDRENPQELIANEFKNILQSKIKLPQLATEEEINVSLSDDYHFAAYETPEHKSLASSLDCYIESEKDSDLIKVSTHFVIFYPQQQIKHKRKFFEKTEESTDLQTKPKKLILL